ncbi:hypothetical protein GW864_04960, partial [bacterium]|nr:hypothetical protein [bacterium]
PTTISAITEKIWPLVEAWQTRSLETVYPFVFLDAIHLNLKRDGGKLMRCKLASFFFLSSSALKSLPLCHLALSQMTQTFL